MPTTASQPPIRSRRSLQMRLRATAPTHPDVPTPFGLAPFQVAHLAALEAPALLRPALRLFATGYHQAGPALTFVEHDRIVGCAGLMIEGSEALAWAFFSAPLNRRSLKRLHRSFRRSLPKLKRLHGFGVIRTDVHPHILRGVHRLIFGLVYVCHGELLRPPLSLSSIQGSQFSVCELRSRPVLSARASFSRV